MLEFLNLIFHSFWTFIGSLLMLLIITNFVLNYQKRRLNAKVVISNGYRNNPKPTKKVVSKPNNPKHKNTQPISKT